MVNFGAGVFLERGFPRKIGGRCDRVNTIKQGA